MNIYGDEGHKELNGKDRLWLELVQQQVGSLQFGIVQIVVHNSREVQIDRTEKVRLDRKES
jgi:hypothetical protein